MPLVVRSSATQIDDTSERSPLAEDENVEIDSEEYLRKLNIGIGANKITILIYVVFMLASVSMVIVGAIYYSHDDYNNDWGFTLIILGAVWIVSGSCRCCFKICEHFELVAEKKELLKTLVT